MRLIAVVLILLGFIGCVYGNDAAEKTAHDHRLSKKFFDTLDDKYPGAVPLEHFIEKLSHVLRYHGFHRGNFLPMLSTCRDEICDTLFDQVERHFGHPFQLGALAGMIFAGSTGFGAASHHAPEPEGKPMRYVVISGPHIAINDSGYIGQVKRHGQHEESAACGALVGLVKDLNTNGITPVDPSSTDYEMSLVKYKLTQGLTGEKGSFALYDITQRAYLDIKDTVKTLMESTLAGMHAEKVPEYLSISIVHIHGPHYRDFIWVGHAAGSVEDKPLDITEELTKHDKDKK